MRASTLFAAVILFFCASSAQVQSQEKKNIRLVLVSLSWNSEIPLRVAIAKGYFKEQGLGFEPIFIRGGPAALAAMISGDADFGSIGGAQAVIRARSRGLDVSIIGSISNTTNYAIVGSKGIKNVGDLKGKIVGVTGAGAFSDFAVRMYLKKSRLEPDKDVILRAVGRSEERRVGKECRL